jgi:hypothetical protein
MPADKIWQRADANWQARFRFAAAIVLFAGAGCAFLPVFSGTGVAG